MKLNDKIRGAIVGYAFGDALGLGTEFMTKEEAEAYYPGGLRHLKDIIRDAHRCQWEPGDWTNDTEIIARILESVLERGRIELPRVTRSLQAWFQESPADLAPMFRFIFRHPNWLDDPIATCHRIWEDKEITEASNEALGRALVTALVSDEKELLRETRNLVSISHDDLRCIATTQLLALYMRDLLDRDRETPYDVLLNRAQDLDSRVVPYLEKAHQGDIRALHLDDEVTLALTRKGMAAAFWASWHCNSPEDMIYSLVDEAGDADTNAALAGALAGIKYGYEALPEEKKNLRKLDYLLDLADRVTEYARERRFR